MHEGTFPDIRQASSHKTGSFQSPAALSSTSALENHDDEVWSANVNTATRCSEGPDLVVHTITNVSLLPNHPEGGISSYRVGCFIKGLGCQLRRKENERSLECGRSPIPYQLARAEDCLLSNSVLPEGEIRSQCASSARQSDSDCVPESHGGSFHDPFMSLSTRDMGVVPSTEDSDSRRISAWSGEHGSRLGVPASQRQQQLAIVTNNFRCSESIAWPLLDRPICIQTQSPVANILQLETGPGCSISRCIFDAMAGRITIFIPTILSDWQGSLEDSERGSESSLSDSSSLAWPNMVFSVANYADGLPNPASSVSRAAVEYGSTASPTVARGEIVPDRMACLRQSYQMQGLSERVAELLIQFWRNNTNSTYNSVWRKWHRWCVERNYNPFSTSLSSVLQFLAEQFDSGLQYRSVNTLRSAINTVETILS